MFRNRKILFLTYIFRKCHCLRKFLQIIPKLLIFLRLSTTTTTILIISQRTYARMQSYIPEHVTQTTLTKLMAAKSDQPNIFIGNFTA